jgi:hypothetical protein
MSQTNPIFQRFLKWAEVQKPISRSDSLSVPNFALDSIQSSPHQRITRYGILMHPLLKLATDDIKPKLVQIQKEVDGLCR